MNKMELGSKTAIKEDLQMKRQFVKSLMLGKRIKNHKNGLK